MAQFLQSVLKIDKNLFQTGMSKLEASTGHSAVDVKLIADITSKTHKIMRSLGLDTNDTTGHELYHSLISAVRCGQIETLLADADYVLIIIDGKIISFNMIDVIENSHHELSYEKQIISHGQRSLRGELVDRYIKHARTNEATTRHIATSFGLLTDVDA